LRRLERMRKYATGVTKRPLKAVISSHQYPHTLPPSYISSTLWAPPTVVLTLQRAGHSVPRREEAQGRPRPPRTTMTTFRVVRFDVCSLVAV
jgi:hypothetical protein